MEEGPSLLEELTNMPVAPKSAHPRRELEEALQDLANSHLRAQPLIPPEAKPEDVDSGDAWPQVFCAFQGCSWSSLAGTEVELHQHVVKAHKPELQSVAQHLPKPLPTDALTSVYNEAIALRCREAAPVAGCSRDRSALRSFATATSQDKVESLICFSCACIHPRVADSTEPSGRIHWRKLINESHPEITEKLHEILSIDQYLRRYNDLAGDVKLEDVANFDEWTVTIPGFGDILCCPEDHRCQANPQHPAQHTLCEHCEGEMPPLSLCNDMWTGYSPARLHEQKVTVMEMICASPCITTLICMSMEARHRSEGTTLDEKAQNASHRLGARGNALTFPLPWEDLLRNLQAHEAEAARAQEAAGAHAEQADNTPSFPRSGKALGEVVRVLLKTNRTGTTSESEIKTLLHQATVRREVVVSLILDMQRLGHPAFQHLQHTKVQEAAAQLPEGGVPPEVLKIIQGMNEEDETAHKLQPQKAAAPTDAPEQD
ncbi:anks1b, partial [Symbiodinium necroappetens]